MQIGSTVDRMFENQPKIKARIKPSKIKFNGSDMLNQILTKYGNIDNDKLNKYDARKNDSRAKEIPMQ